MNPEACSNDMGRTQAPYVSGLETSKLATYLGDLSLNKEIPVRPQTSKPSLKYRAAITKNPVFNQGDIMAVKPDLSEFSGSVKNGIYYTGSIDVRSDAKGASVPIPTQQMKLNRPNTEQTLLTLNPYIRPVSASEIAASVHGNRVRHTMPTSAAVSSFPEMSAAVSHTHILQRNSFLRPLNGAPANKIRQTSYNLGNSVTLIKQDICDSSLQRQNSFDSDSSPNSCSSTNSSTFSNTTSLSTTDHHKHTDPFSNKSSYTSSCSSVKVNMAGSQASLKLDMNTNFNSAKSDMEASSNFKQDRSVYDMPSQSHGIFPSILSESQLFTTPGSVKSTDHCQPMTPTLSHGMIGSSGHQTYKKVPVTSTLTGLVYYKRISESKTNSILASENRNYSNMAWQNLYEKTAGSGTLAPSLVNHISLLPNCNSSFEKSGAGVQSHVKPATETRTDITYQACQNISSSAKVMQSGKSANPPNSLKNVMEMMQTPAGIPLKRKNIVQHTSKLPQDKHFQKASGMEASARKNCVVSNGEQRSVGDGAPSNRKRFSEAPQTRSNRVRTTLNAEYDEEESDDCDDEGNDDAFSGSLEEDEEKESFAKGERLPGDGEANFEDTDEDSELENFEDTTDDGTTDSSSGKKSNCENCARPRTADSSQAHAEESSRLDNSLKSAIQPATSTVPVVVKPAFRYSLFCNIPPTINFVSEGERAEQLPLKLSRLLKWKVSPITPVVVKSAIARVGFRISKKNDWLGCFGKHMKSSCFKSLQDYQKLNHFPGSFQIGRKDKLWRSLSKMQVHFGKQEFNFFPQTFVLPNDIKQLKQAWEEGSTKQKWIIKPPASARGIGIRVISKWSQIPRRRPVIVQKYIHRPFLINSSKFDMRIYVYVSCYDPLRLYVYEDGLARFASCKYSSSSKTFNNRYMHLTNYSINKKNAEYLSNTDNTICQGHKWSLKALWNYMKRQGINTNLIWETIRDLIIKTIISGDSVICSMTKFNTSSRYCCHELFGFDILLDENFKPWILEVNISPSLHSNSELDINIKGAMIKDMLNIAGFRLPDERDINNTQLNTDTNNYSPMNVYCMDKRLFTAQLAPDERAKHAFYCQKYLDELNNLAILGASKAMWASSMLKESYLRRHMQVVSSILNILTPDDIRVLCESIDEDSRKGNFQRLFPTPNTYRYLRYFEQPRYYNLLLDQWVLHYNHKEQKGIHLLQSYCEKGIHLQNPTTDPQHQWTVPKPNFAGIRSSDVRCFGLHNSARESGRHSTAHRNAKKLPLRSGQLSQSSSTTSLRSLAPSPHLPQTLPSDLTTSSSSSLVPLLSTPREDHAYMTEAPA